MPDLPAPVFTIDLLRDYLLVGAALFALGRVGVARPGSCGDAVVASASGTPSGRRQRSSSRAAA